MLSWISLLCIIAHTSKCNIVIHKWGGGGAGGFSFIQLVKFFYANFAKGVFFPSNVMSNFLFIFSFQFTAAVVTRVLVLKAARIPSCVVYFV